MAVTTTTSPSTSTNPDPIQVESVKIPRSVLTVLTVEGTRRQRSRAFIIRETLSMEAKRLLEDAGIKDGVEQWLEGERPQQQAVAGSSNGASGGRGKAVKAKKASKRKRAA